MPKPEITTISPDNLAKFVEEVGELAKTSAFMLVLSMNDTAPCALILSQMLNPREVVKQEKLTLLNKVNEALDGFINSIDVTPN